MSVKLFIEGGGSKDDKIRCREAFRKLFEKAGFTRVLKLTASGGRSSAFDDFKKALLATGPSGFVAMLIDSEDPVADVDLTWRHLQRKDGWQAPPGAENDQVLLMTTCMETWIVAGRATLRTHYGQHLQESALPPTHDLERRDRHSVQDALVHATRNCANQYKKGKRSFQVLEKLDPNELRPLLPSYARLERILGAKVDA